MEKARYKGTMSDPGAQPSWFSDAARREVVRRAVMYAVVVGAVLIGINHGDALARGELGGGRVMKMGLTLVVPYVVSTLSSVGTIRSLRGRSGSSLM